jgi:hypothetical protein
MSKADVAARIAAARAELEELEKAREAREALAAESKLEELEREVADAKAIAKAEEEHGAGKFAAVKTPLGVVIVKRPEHMHYRRFIGSKDIGIDDAERLVLTCLVHPSRAEFQRISEEYAAIPLEVAGRVLDLAAGRHAEVGKKS